MKRRNQVLFPALMSGMAILALLLGFGLYHGNRPAPEDLPLPPRQSLYNPVISGGSFAPAVSDIPEEIISVNPETVQTVLDTISRPESYTAKYITTWYYNMSQSSIHTNVYAFEGLRKIETLSASGQPELHYLTDGDILCFWEEGIPILTTVSMGQRSSDVPARIPTYESILDMDKSDILYAAYEIYDGRPYITVTTAGQVYDTKWWISLDTALLHKAELTDEDGSPAISIDMFDYSLDIPSETLFILPDSRPFGQLLSEITGP